MLSMKIASAAVKPTEIISSTAPFELAFSLKRPCSRGRVERWCWCEVGAPSCFLGGRVFPAHLCGAGRDPEQGSIALQRAVTHFQIMQVSKALLIQSDEFPSRRRRGQTKRFIGGRFGEHRQSVSEAWILHYAVTRFSKSQLKWRNSSYFCRNYLRNLCLIFVEYVQSHFS